MTYRASKSEWTESVMWSEASCFNPFFREFFHDSVTWKVCDRFSVSYLLVKQVYGSLFLLFSKHCCVQLLSSNLCNSSLLISRLLTTCISFFYLSFFCPTCFLAIHHAALHQFPLHVFLIFVLDCLQNDKGTQRPCQHRWFTSLCS